MCLCAGIYTQVDNASASFEVCFANKAFGAIYWCDF